MRKAKFFLVFGFLAGCQTGAPTVSVEEARDLAISFDARPIQKPERSIDEYRETFTEFATAYPRECGSIRSKRIERLNLLSEGTRSTNVQAQRGYAASLTRAAEKEFQFGNFAAAISALDLAYSSLGQKNSQSRGIIQTQIARVEVARGRDPEARTALALAETRIREIQTLYEREQMFLLAGQALEAQLDQNIRSEEFFLRETIELQKVYGRDAFQRLDGDTLHARLVSNLILQNRVVEAEQVARSFATPIATRHARPGYLGPILTYRVFAEALLSQKRYEEAEFIARATLDLHYRHCSIPTGVPVIEAWRTLFKALAGQGEWDTLLLENKKLERDMAAAPRRYKQAFEQNIDIFMAGLAGATTTVPSDFLDAMIDSHERDTDVALEAADLDEVGANLSPDAVKSIELRLVRALSDRNAGNINAAVTAFDRFLTVYLTSVFTQTASVSDSGTSSRAEFFRNAYIDLLVTDAGAQAAQALGLDRVRELYRVATTLPAGSVQQSFAAAATRASIPDEELASLIRESQDLEVKAKNLSDSLAFLETADDREISPAKLRELRAQVLTFTEAAETLKQEANQKFPAYGALMNPKAPDLNETRRLLNPNEVALVTFSTESRTLVWGIPKTGKVEFAVADLGKERLEHYVNRVRASLDPTSVQFIRDIPKFDTGTAYNLYEAILQPVEGSWSSADNILAVTPGPLANLPLSLLPKSKPDLSKQIDLLFANYRDIDWLANDHAVTILPSIATLKNLRAAPAIVATRKPFIWIWRSFLF